MRLSRPAQSIASLLALAIATGGCSRATTAPEPARPPSLSATGVPLCALMPSQLRPLIVEWTGADRGALELRLRRGLVAVRYEGCELEVLRDCVVPGEYGYAGFTRKRDTVTIHSSDDLFTQMPVGAARLAAKLERVGSLHVDMTLVGMYESSRTQFRDDELAGRCGGATHVLVAAQVGAFSLYAGTSTDVEATGAMHGASHEILNSDGAPAACEQAATTDRAPPEGCGALLRLEFSPLRAATRPAAQAAVVAPPAKVDDPPATPTVDPFVGSAVTTHAESKHDSSPYRPVDPTKIRHPLSQPEQRRPKPQDEGTGVNPMLAAGAVLPIVGLIGGLSLGITGLSRMTEIKDASKQPGLDQAELDDLEHRRKSALGLEIAGASLAFVTWSAGAILLVLSGTRDDNASRRISRAPRWRVTPMLSRTHGGVNLTLRF